MRKRKLARLHSEDARFLRNMLLDMHDRLTAMESVLGQLQHHYQEFVKSPTEPDTEILEV